MIGQRLPLDVERRLRIGILVRVDVVGDVELAATARAPARHAVDPADEVVGAREVLLELGVGVLYWWEGLVHSTSGGTRKVFTAASSQIEKASEISPVNLGYWYPDSI